MSENDRQFREDMLEVFLFETVLLVEQLEELLIEIEEDNDLSANSVNEIFRIMHTIKGSSAMMMYDNISVLAHSLESAFDTLRNDLSIKVDLSILTDIVLRTVDFIKSEIIKIENGKEADGSSKDIIDTIENFAADKFMGNKIEKETVSKIENEIVYDVENETTSKFEFSHYSAKIYFQNDCQMENMRAYTVIHQIEPVVNEIAYYPQDILDNEETSEYIRQNGFFIQFTSYKNLEEITEDLEQILFVEKVEIENINKEDASYLYSGAKPGSIEPESEKIETVQRESKQIQNESEQEDIDEHPDSQKTDQFIDKNNLKKNSLITVNVKKMDMLMDLVGELVIAEAMVTRNPDLEGLELDNFNKATSQLRKLTNELQDVVMSIRLIPIASTFTKMQRIVRDMKRKLNKEVELELVGEETEIDKNIAELISDPLMHIIRNALDHGIEDAQTRIDSGKPKQGKLVLEAKNAGGDIWITIRDDGKGLDPEVLYRKAKEKGIADKAFNEYSEKEILSFILLPGFSTKENVSEFSGRGVGMDVARENISKLGGNIMIESKKGFGTSIRIKIPMTLAIIDGMLIGIGDKKYILPTTSIRECFKATSKQLFNDSENNEMIMIRGECYSILRLYKKLEIESIYAELDEGIIVVVEEDDEVICLFADALLGKQQVVVKPIPKYIKKSKTLSGCTILGDGSISLILDAKGLIDNGSDI